MLYIVKDINQKENLDLKEGDLVKDISYIKEFISNPLLGINKDENKKECLEFSKHEKKVCLSNV